VAWVSKLSIPGQLETHLGRGTVRCHHPFNLEIGQQFLQVPVERFDRESYVVFSVDVLFELEDSGFLPARLKSAKVWSGSPSE